MRVVAGRYGGRTLRAPRGTDVRPTADRVREALFSILGPVEGHSVLDLFAGTGALGIEALSRGASSCVFVDLDTRPVQANLEALGIDAEVRRGGALSALRAGDQYDLVLLDPPYRDAARLGPELTEALPPVLGPSARVVSESDRRHPLELGLPLHDERRYGDTLIRIHTV
jgi:16S rRNA (guanine(966)-N(2))-methyltransferase RsmD